MVSLEVETFVSKASMSPWRMFAEPDWRGDVDYRGPEAEGDLDAKVAALSLAIEVGREAGQLDDYYSRRAAFDLQSIRSQIARERSGLTGSITPDRLGAILSRLDRLAACVADLALGD